MSKAPLTLLALAAVVAGILVFLLRGREPDGRVAQAPGAELAAPSTARPSVDLAPAEAPPDQPAAEDDIPPKAGARRVAGEVPSRGDHTSFATEDATWIEVDVRLPSGIPLDDSPVLLAFSSLLEAEMEDWEGQQIAKEVDLTDAFVDDLDDDLGWARRELDGSGTVRVPLARGAPTAVLVLVSRYVHAPPVFVHAAAGRATLEGELGAWVTGRLVIPERALARGAEPDDIDLEIQGRPREGGSFFEGEDAREVRIREDFSFEVRALSASSRYAVHAEAEGLVDYLELSLEVEPGDHRVLEIPLEAGATISGHVRGEDGSPIAGANVEAETSGRMLLGGNEEEADTAEDGSYTLAGVAAGKVAIRVAADGWISSEELELEVAKGQEVLGFDVVLSRGDRISGTVRWPDRKAAAGAEVSASVHREHDWSFQLADKETGVDGRFELTGLSDGPFEVRASARPEGEEPQVDRPWELLHDSGDGEWRAVLSEVAANTTGVELVLKPPLELPGIVRDDTGAAIGQFTIEARPVGAPEWGSADAVSALFESQDGSFALHLFPGDWLVEAQAEGYSSTLEPIPVTVPWTGEPLALVLNRGVDLEGLVVDPFGNPVAEAEVIAHTGPREPFRVNQQDSATSREDGRFAFEGLPLEGLTLSASHEEWATSEGVPVELAPGESTQDVLLRLRIGATITGEVYDESGEPDVGQQVMAGSGSSFGFGSGEHRAVTDDAGRFVLERLTPGRVVVTAMPSEEEILQAVEEADGEETAIIGFFGRMRMETVEVEDGEEVHVVLGHEPKLPVRVHGVVREAGEPLAGAGLFAIEEGGAILQGMKATKTDEAGRYELVLDRPGDFVFNLNLEGGFGGNTIPFYVDVPEVEDLEHDLELPLGRISGRVFGPDGAPATGVSVRISRAEGVFGIEDIDQSNVRSAQADGSYSFEHLHPGEYSVHVGAFASLFTSENVRFGAAVVDGIELGADEVVDDVDLHLDTAGRLTGTVRDEAGAPVAGAAIFVRDEAGRVISNISACITDAAGRFSHGGLAPGPVTVSARGDGLASADSEAVEITPGGESSVELIAESGTTLVVTLLEEGEPVRARVQVLDEEGRQVNGLVRADVLERLFSEGFSSKERRVGPLPPGRYSLVATTSDGKDARKAVSVRSGQKERHVRLRLR